MQSVYCDFNGSSITVNDTAAKNEVEEFWESIWEKETKTNKDAELLKELEETYYKEVTPKNYKIGRQIVDKVIKNMPLNSHQVKT